MESSKYKLGFVPLCVKVYDIFLNTRLSKIFGNFPGSGGPLDPV